MEETRLLDSEIMYINGLGLLASSLLETISEAGQKNRKANRPSGNCHEKKPILSFLSQQLHYVWRTVEYPNRPGYDMVNFTVSGGHGIYLFIYLFKHINTG